MDGMKVREWHSGLLTARANINQRFEDWETVFLCEIVFCDSSRWRYNSNEFRSVEFLYQLIFLIFNWSLQIISFFHIPDMKENKEESDDSHIAHLRKSLSSLIMGVLSRAACADQPLSFTAVNVITKFLIKTLREMVEENEASWGKSVRLLMPAFWDCCKC